MKVLVTGSSGFIGFHLAKNLLERGFKIHGLDSMNNYYDVKIKKDRLAILKKYRNFSFTKNLLHLFYIFGEFFFQLQFFV